VARVFLRPGEGKFQVNGRPAEAYFTTESQRGAVRQSLQTVDMQGQFDAMITVRGGGVSAQADAIRMGIARALLKVDVELRGRLKKAGLLTRDSRGKERKKYGQKGARKRFQFSKR
jgi:small subunit ribosomal protein S9